MNARTEHEASYHHTAEFAERVRLNQRELAANLKPQYDFIVCGAGSSGSVVAGRLAENPAVDRNIVGRISADQVDGFIAEERGIAAVSRASPQMSL